jgi:acid phosphatase (class A)
MKTILNWMLCTVLVCSLAQAKDEGNPTKWLTRDQEAALVATVPAAPAPNSEQDRDDLAKVLEAQKNRTAAVIAECKRDRKFSYTLFESVYGADAGKNAKFIAMMKNVLATTWAVNEPAKDKYKRPRPYLAHPGVVKALFPVNGYSYPSGHSMGSYTLAVVFGAIFPDKKQAFLDRAAQIAQSRVDAGVHNPSDIQEGEVLGKATGAAIVASPAFQADLAQLQADLQKK